MEVEQKRIDEASSTKEGESRKADEVEAPLPKKIASSKMSIVWTHFEKIYDVQGVRKGNHKGDAMTSELKKVLKEWGIERVFSISADNASSNQKMIDTLRKKIKVTKKVMAGVVQKGLNDVKTSVTKIRNAVKYVRSAPARLKKFKEFVDSEALDPRKKFEYMEDVLQQIYGDKKGKHLFDGVKITMSELFDEYKKKLQHDPSSSLITQPTSVSTEMKKFNQKDSQGTQSSVNMKVSSSNMDIIDLHE
ncbi:zinc finger BED domain-containing protein RICESLEEPER 2-like [Canna indica]|uniref:Zinc finger BED domain-containing protein RICESLEEPER 2-like n=1 Tax=Canna indica TaxID=4628 RepID=A0AAQ3QRV2_9LILI|nr:zinc finger BED domain-containing protein RICESLEEPER 2-like [Canna indica]